MSSKHWLSIKYNDADWKDNVTDWTNNVSDLSLSKSLNGWSDYLIGDGKIVYITEKHIARYSLGRECVRIYTIR